MLLAADQVPRHHLRLVGDGPRLVDEYMSARIEPASRYLRISSMSAMIDDPSILLFISIAFLSSPSSSSSSPSSSSSSPR
jgi:hypothetical protein